jgi:hypothetical protein
LFQQGLRQCWICNHQFNGTYAVSARAQLVLIIDHSRFVPEGWASVL